MKVWRMRCLEPMKSTLQKKTGEGKWWQGWNEALYFWCRSLNNSWGTKNLPHGFSMPIDIWDQIMQEAVPGHNYLAASLVSTHLMPSSIWVVTTKKHPQTLPDVPWEKGQIIPAWELVCPKRQREHGSYLSKRIIWQDWPAASQTQASLHSPDCSLRMVSPHWSALRKKK